MLLSLVQAQAAQLPELEEQVEGLQRSAAKAGRMRQAVAQMQEEVAQLPVLKQVLKDLQVNTQQMARVKQDIERLKVRGVCKRSLVVAVHVLASSLYQPPVNMFGVTGRLSGQRRCGFAAARCLWAGLGAWHSWQHDLPVRRLFEHMGQQA
jgi:phage/plasmid primase-like uncharacterized protein